MNDLLEARHKKRLTILCVITTLAILLATLWPFNPSPSNRVTWLPRANGIAFGSPGLVVSKTPLHTQAALDMEPRTLELFLRPASLLSSYAILSFYVPNHPAQLRVRQWTDILLIAHDVLDKQHHPIEKTLDIGQPFHQGQLMLLSIAFTQKATVVYVNGKLVRTSANFVIGPQELSGQIVMGNSAVNYAPWPGEIRGMAIYSKGLTAAEVSEHYSAWVGGHVLTPPELHDAIAYYAFTEGAGRVIHNAAGSAPDLDIPEIFAVLHKPMLKSVREEFDPSWNYVSDILRNIAGFMPLGFVFCAYFSLARSRRQAILYATLAGGFLSFVIEVLQAYIPQRGSGVTDIITNTLGSVLGALLVRPALIRTVLVRALEPRRQQREG